MMVKLNNCVDAELLITSIELIKVGCGNFARLGIRDWFEYDNDVSKCNELIEKIKAITKSGDYPVVIMMNET